MDFPRRLTMETRALACGGREALGAPPTPQTASRQCVPSNPPCSVRVSHVIPGE